MIQPPRPKCLACGTVGARIRCTFSGLQKHNKKEKFDLRI